MITYFIYNCVTCKKGALRDDSDAVFLCFVIQERWLALERIHDSRKNTTVIVHYCTYVTQTGKIDRFLLYLGKRISQYLIVLV